MHQATIAGAAGMLRDPHTGQLGALELAGTVYFVCQGDPAPVARELVARVLSSANQLLSERLQAGQLAMQTVIPSLPALLPEVARGCQAHTLGAQIQNLELRASLRATSSPAPMPPNPIQATQQAFAQRAKDAVDPRNYEVEAEVEIGGFKLRGSTDKGFDDKGLVDQAKDKAKTEVIWYGIGCVIVLLVVIGLVALAGYIYVKAKESSGVGPSKVTAWDGKTPFTCKASDNVTIENVTASLPDSTAISAEANCKLVLKNVNITAKDGVVASGNAQVTVTGGSVTATGSYAKTTANGQITFSGTTVKGKKESAGASKITGP